MVYFKLRGRVCLAALVFAATAGAANISNLQHSDARSMSITGTSLEFKYATGGAMGEKALNLETFTANSNVAVSGDSATFTSGAYSTTAFSTGISAGSTVTSATIDFAALVQQAIALSAPVFQPSPRSFSTNSGCTGGLIVATGGNCKNDPVRISATGTLFLLKSLTIGATTHTFSGAGLVIPVNPPGSTTLNLASVQGSTNFLSALGGGGQISMTWTQAVTVTGSALQNSGADATPPSNMNCRDCTIYYTATTTTAQQTALRSIFNATYTPQFSQVPEPSTYAMLGGGLLALAMLRRRRAN